MKPTTLFKMLTAAVATSAALTFTARTVQHRHADLPE